MKPYSKRFGLSALAALLLLAVSCGDSGSTAGTQESGTVGVWNAVEETEVGVSWESSGLPQIDFEGRNFKILSITPTAPTHTWQFVDAAETTGDVINDAIFERNTRIEEIYNISIDAEYSDGTITTYRQAVLSGDSLYAAMYNLLSYMTTLSLEGLFYNYYELPHINMEAAWWDQSMVENLTVDDRLYVLSGDISPHINNKAFVFLFNKDMCSALGLDMPYQMVLDGKWTQDVLAQYVKNVNADLNGDGKMDWNDRWGYLSEQANGYITYLSFGGRVTEQNADGRWQIAFDSDGNISLAQAAVEMVCDQTTTLLADPYANENSWSAVSSWYAAGGALIRSSALEPIPRDFRSLDVNFGILPYPKLDESQKDYITLVGDGNVFSVPVTADPAFSSLILEALAVESVESVTPAFYDRCLEGKILRDEESKAMLDIIFASKTFDVGLTNNDVAFTTMMSTVVTSGDASGLVSTFHSNLKKAQKAVDGMYEQLADIE